MLISEHSLFEDLKKLFELLTLCFQDHVSLHYRMLMLKIQLQQSFLVRSLIIVEGSKVNSLQKFQFF